MKDPGIVLWLTGLSGAGKTTLAHEVEARFLLADIPVQVLDGDMIRNTINKDLGFSIEDRKENIRRVSHLAQLLIKNGIHVIVSFISPFKEAREDAKKMMQNSRTDLIEVFVDAPLEICEKRDKKGLYKKARSGEISDFTGISQDYEKPLKPDVICHTDKESVEQSTQKILEHLRQFVSI